MICSNLVVNHLGCGCKINCICSKSVCCVRSEIVHGNLRKVIYYHFGNDIYRMLYSDYIKRNSLLYQQLNLFENEKD